MPSRMGTVRRLAMAPSLAEVSFARRGFAEGDPQVTRQLESIPRSVVVGFEAGIEARDLAEITWRLDLVAPELQGFAYEGATMALTILDQLVPGHTGRSHELLTGPARRHSFLTYIGIGFAMARLPRRFWSRVLPDLSGTPYYPDLSWLAVDGYGFDLAYFHTRRWVDEQRVPRPYPWLGDAGYFPRAVDQGIGRALWFIHVARPARVAEAVARFPAPRRSDLWSGVGLAAAFAGGASDAALRQLQELAGEYAPELAQGASFAAKARAHAELVPPHTAAAVRALTGVSAVAAAGIVDRAVDIAPSVASSPTYDHWRTEVRNHFARITPHSA